MTGGAVQGQGDDYPRVSDRHSLGPTIARPRLTPNGAEKAGHGAPWHPCIIDAWGVEPKAGPAGRIVDSRCMKDREIDAGEPGGSKPPRRLSGRRCGAHCARQCRAKCGRAPQERPHECREHRDRQCAEVGAVGRCTCAKHSAQAVSASANGEPRACAGEAGARRAKRGGERGAKRARGCCGRRRTSVTVVRRRLKRERNGPRHPRCFGE